VVLGEMIGVEAGAIVSLRNGEAILVIVRERPRIAIEMVEDAEFHRDSARAVSFGEPSSSFG
jgi:hypothetical protein